jgi:hypothetical protein
MEATENLWEFKAGKGSVSFISKKCGGGGKAVNFFLL